MKLKIAILGSTGVLGDKFVNYLCKNNINISLLTCFNNYKKLLVQQKRTKCKNSIVLNPHSYQGNLLKVGEEELVNYIKNNKIDFFYVLNTGFQSLKFIHLIIKNQKNCCIAIANKEVLIAGGNLLVNKIYDSKNSILPLDSEHFSLYEYLSNQSLNNIEKIFLTATGGPFYFKKNFKKKKITFNQATYHPIWKMGSKNSIDSSNLINKFLECFELSSLFRFPLNKIDILISPKAFAHSLVFYKDHRISINCFKNDMLIPLTSPFSFNNILKNSDYIDTLNYSGQFKFMKFDNKNFQIFKYYKNILKFNHSKQIVFMMLNAEAVNRFTKNEITYDQIIPFIFKYIDNLHVNKVFKTLYDILKYTNMLSVKIKNLQ